MASKIIKIFVLLLFCLITASCAAGLSRHSDSDPANSDSFDSEEETVLSDEESKEVVALLSNKSYAFELGEIRDLSFFDNYSLEAHADRNFLAYGESSKGARYYSESVINLRGIYKLFKADGTTVKIKMIFDSIQINAFLHDDGGATLSIEYPDEKIIEGRILPDGDMDGVSDEFDNCPETPNEGQLDSDGDLIGDECDEDHDEDGILNDNDNCLSTPNPDQFDTDADGIGDICDAVVDNIDSIANAPEPVVPEKLPEDNTVDPIANDPEPVAPEILPEDNDDEVPGDNTPDEGGDLGEVEDEQDDTPIDLDGDGLLDEEDNCPFIANSEQDDTDQDLTGNVCDEDDDGDDVNDQADNCPLIPNDDQTDLNDDGFGDVCDEDDDGDGANDSEDNCPLVQNPSQSDPNGDGVGAACSDNEKKKK